MYDDVSESVSEIRASLITSVCQTQSVRTVHPEDSPAGSEQKHGAAVLWRVGGLTM